MNALALLCNLHADGPLTLQRLRRAGCESLAALIETDPVDLAESLGADHEFAARFQREAALLAERVRGDAPVAPVVTGPEPSAFATSAGVVEEEAPPAPLPQAPQRPSPAILAFDSGVSQETEELAAAEFGSALPVRDEPSAAADAEETEDEAASRARGIAPILETWRSLDQTAPPEEPGFVMPRPEANDATGTSLANLELEGLSGELAVALAGGGIESAEELLEADPLTLANAIGHPFTRIKRLQFLARRTLAKMAPAAAPTGTDAPPPPAPRESTGGQPPRPETGSSGGWIETAGPFA